jgi:11-cis-retinol dehydrogenase
MVLLIILAILAYASYRLYDHFFPKPNINPDGKYVLISGCDSGFGHGLAIELDRQGFRVLAGVLVRENIGSLEAILSESSTVFPLDITKQDDIDAAFELVKSKTKSLHGLVNNAGIAITGSIDWTSMESMRKVMDVNFFGHVAMTKKLLPLLIAKRGSRVVNICSVAGFLANAGMSAYCASKYALESFSDCLRREMAPWGLRVSIIEPGFMRTPILLGRPKTFNDFWSTLSGEVQERWGEDFLQAQYNGAKSSLLIKNAEDPQKVVRALQHAVLNSEPRIRYRPGWQSSVLFFPLSTLPTWIVDEFLKRLSNVNRLPGGVIRQLKD